MSNGDIAAWTGVGATVVLGVIAAAIAWMQYRHGRFDPHCYAYWDSAGQILVRVVNIAAGSGTVENIGILRRRADGSTYHLGLSWVIDGQLTQARPFPFPLGGGGVAQLFLRVDPDETMEGAWVEVVFADGSRPTPALQHVPGRLAGRSTIPGVL